MFGKVHLWRRFYFKIFMVTVCGLGFLSPNKSQFTACTTLGNYTDDIYRGVPIKNSRTSVTISSPNFPKRYPRDIQCTWRIQAPDSFKVQLSFLEFQLEKQSLDLRCHDYISVRDGGFAFKEAEEIWTGCGLEHPPTVYSTAQFLWVRFYSNKEFQAKGFTMKAVTVNGALSKRYLALGILVALLFTIIVVIFVCRKRFQAQQKDAVKVRQYQELPVPTDTEVNQPNPAYRGTEIELQEDLWNSSCNNTEADTTQRLAQLNTDQCSLSEDGILFESAKSRSSRKGISRHGIGKEGDDLEYTELLSVV